MAAERAALDIRAQQLQAETFRLSVDLNTSNEVMRRRHQKTQSRLPLTLDPRNLFHTPGLGQATCRRQIGSRHPEHRFSRGPWSHLACIPLCLIMLQHHRVTSPILWKTSLLRRLVWRLSRWKATLRRRSKREGSENSFRRLWHSRKHTLIVETGSIRPLAQAGARAIAGIWIQRLCQATPSVVTSHAGMARRTMELLTWLTRIGSAKRLSGRFSRQLIMRLTKLFRFIQRPLLKQV